MNDKRVSIPTSVQQKTLNDSLDSISINIDSYLGGIRAGWLFG